MSELLLLFGDFTVRNVVLGASLLGLGAGVLGCFVVLRGESLVGDMLSHAALPGVCLGFLVAGSRQLLPIVLGAMLSGVVAALFMLLLLRRTRIKSDAATGIALSLFFALGTVLLTYIANRSDASQAGLDAFLFGQAAALLPADVRLGAITTFLALALVALFWKELKLATFDRSFALSLGLPVLALDALLALAVALMVTVGLQLVGVVLMTATLVAPAVAARQWCRTLGGTVLLAGLFGAGAGAAGTLGSASGAGLATGPLVVVAASLLAFVSLLVAPERGLLFGWWAGLRRRSRLRSRLRQGAAGSPTRLAGEGYAPGTRGGRQ